MWAGCNNYHLKTTCQIYLFQIEMAKVKTVHMRWIIRAAYSWFVHVQQMLLPSLIFSVCQQAPSIVQREHLTMPFKLSPVLKLTNVPEPTQLEENHHSPIAAGFFLQLRFSLGELILPPNSLCFQFHGTRKTFFFVKFVKS